MVDSCTCVISVCRQCHERRTPARPSLSKDERKGLHHALKRADRRAFSFSLLGC